MINKQSMWFLTLFTLVIVLGVYYITMPNDLLKGKITSDEIEETTEVEVTSTDALVAMRANRNEELSSEVSALETILSSESSTVEQKNEAFENLKILNLSITQEEELENKIEEDFGIKSYIEIKDDTIKVVINSSEHDVTLANNIMRSIQEEYIEKMYITVTFE